MNLTALTNDELKKLAPQVFTETASDKVSDKYVHIPTFQIVEDMKALGWEPCDAKCVKARKGGADYKKHLVKFFNPELTITSDDDSMVPQILLTNGHDGSTGFRFQIGIFRFICENGMVVMDKDYGSFKMRHMGYTFDELKESITNAVSKLPNLVNKINSFQMKEMTDVEMKTFAEKAILARFGEERQVTGISLDELLAPERKLDEGSNLWVVFNRVQEKLTHGSFTHINAKGKLRKARGIKNFQQDMELNEKLWELAEEYVVA
jgi:hypothetical protein